MGLTPPRAGRYDRSVRRFFTILTLVLLTACGADAPSSSTATPEIPATVDPDLVVCESDADCVAVPAGCCSCFEGGGATAVNKQSRYRWDVHRTQACAPGCCDNEPSPDVSCAASPVCVNGQCKLR